MHISFIKCMLDCKARRVELCIFMFLNSLEDCGNAIFSVIMFSFGAMSYQEIKIMVMDPQNPQI